MGAVHSLTLLHAVLTRQADISKQRHSEIYTGYSKAIAQVQFGHVVGQDALGMLGLDPWEYKLWQSFSAETKQYTKSTQEDLSHIQRIGVLGPSRVLGPGKPCTCLDKVAYCGQCPHDICKDDGRFLIEKWPARFHHRDGLHKSMNTPGSQAGTNEIGILDDFKRDGSDSMPDDGHGGDIDEDARANGSQEDCSDEEDYEDKGNIQQTSAVLPGVASQVKKAIDFGTVMAVSTS